MASQIVPPAVPARVAHEYGHDVVIVFTLSHADELCRVVSYGRSGADKSAAERLSKVLHEILADRGVLS